MPYGHWQYLSHAEPVLPTARTAVPGVVPPPLDMMPVRRPAAVALLVAACAFVHAPAPAAPVTLAAWQPGMAEPVRRQARVADHLTGAERPVEVPESQHVTWYQPLSEPPRRPIRPLDYVTGAECPREVPESQHVTWWPRTDLPPQPARRLIDPATGAERPLEIPTSQHVTWYQPLAEPPRAPERARPETGAEFVHAPAVLVVPVLAWQVPLSEPVRRIPRAADFRTGGEFVPIPPAPAARAIDWSPQIQIPVRVALRAVDFRTGAELVQAPALVVPTFIAGPLSQPVRRPVWIIPGTGAEWVWAPDELLEWASPLALPVRRIARTVDFRTGGELVIVPPAAPARPLDWSPVQDLPILLFVRRAAVDFTSQTTLTLTDMPPPIDGIVATGVAVIFPQLSGLVVVFSDLDDISVTFPQLSGFTFNVPDE